jgi:hypothetical protein
VSGSAPRGADHPCQAVLCAEERACDSPGGGGRASGRFPASTARATPASGQVANRAPWGSLDRGRGARGALHGQRRLRLSDRAASESLHRCRGHYRSAVSGSATELRTPRPPGRPAQSRSTGRRTRRAPRAGCGGDPVVVETGRAAARRRAGVDGHAAPDQPRRHGDGLVVVAHVVRAGELSTHCTSVDGSADGDRWGSGYPASVANARRHSRLAWATELGVGRGDRRIDILRSGECVAASARTRPEPTTPAAPAPRFRISLPRGSWGASSSPSVWKPSSRTTAPEFVEKENCRLPSFSSF